MKDFFKYVLATVVGLVGVWIIFSALSFLMLIAMVAAGDAKPNVKDNTVLKISLTGMLNERAVENPFAELFGNKALDNQGLKDLLEAIKAAKEIKKVKGIYIEA
ncbi:MAG: signal peptide peptidase SppA, partial [Alloprevotella sp.]|nr:signal peptide peptidase SppA [Alloprevotella sp.]